MIAVLEVTLPVFGLVLCGWIATARRMLPEQTVDGLNAFVYWFALPAMLFRIAGLRPINEMFEPRFALGFILAGLSGFVLTLVLARRGLLGGRAHSMAQSAALALNAAHGNIGYLGIALIGQIGESMLPTVALAIICDNFVLIALTVLILESQRERTSGGSVAVTALRGIVVSPLLGSILAGVLVSLTGQTLPAVVDSFTRLLAGAAGPCALFAIGASLGNRRLVLDREIASLIGIKLLWVPIVAAGVFLVVGADPRTTAVGIVCAALPAASNGFIIAQRYSMKTESIGASILGGTAISVITISLIIWASGLR